MNALRIEYTTLKKELFGPVSRLTKMDLTHKIEVLRLLKGAHDKLKPIEKIESLIKVCESKEITFN